MAHPEKWDDFDDSALEEATARAEWLNDFGVGEFGLEKSENLPRESRLFNEKIVRLREGFPEYVAIGVDPFTFKPIVRICNTDGMSTSYVSLAAECFGSLITFLREAVDDDGWSVDMTNDTGVTVGAILNDICHLTSEYGKVAITGDAASLLAYEKAVEIYKIAKRYSEGYSSYRHILKKYRLIEYQKYFPNGLDHLKACTEFPILTKYFGNE